MREKPYKSYYMNRINAFKFAEENLNGADIFMSDKNYEIIQYKYNEKLSGYKKYKVITLPFTTSRSTREKLMYDLRIEALGITE